MIEFAPQLDQDYGIFCPVMRDTRIDNDDAYLTTGDAAKVADKSPETIRMWERLGRLPAIRTAGGQRLFRQADVLRAVRELEGGKRRAG